MYATEVTAGLAESNGSLLPGLWRDSLHATCGLTACTPGSAPGPTLGNEYGKTLPFYLATIAIPVDSGSFTSSAAAADTDPLVDEDGADADAEPGRTPHLE